MTTKVAIVGSGFGTYCLLPAFSRTHGCKVVSICGNHERLRRLKEIDHDKIYTNWKQMLQKEKPDAVCIAVVPKYQYEIAKYALNNKIAVFAEKPLATSLNEASELYLLAKKSNTPNMVDFIFPEIPEWIKAKEIIQDGAIGKILNINVEWDFLSYDLKNNIKSWKTNANEGGGALSFFFSHVFYYLEYFIGRIKSLECCISTSEKSTNRGDTIVNVVTLFENGCIGNAHLNISYTGQQKHAIEFQGDEGTITLQNNTDSVVDNFELTISNRGETRKLEPNTSYELLNDNSEDPRIKPVGSIAKRFINWCNTGEASKPDFQDGLRVQELIEMAKVSNSKFLE